MEPPFVDVRVQGDVARIAQYLGDLANRETIAQVGGKKELTGRTDIAIEISNQCARLIANTILYYNSTILSRLLDRYEASGNAKALALIKTTSPAAWRHVHLNGHYTFRSTGQIIDLDAILAGLDLG